MALALTLWRAGYSYLVLSHAVPEPMIYAWRAKRPLGSHATSCMPVIAYMHQADCVVLLHHKNLVGPHSKTARLPRRHMRT